MLIQGGLVLIYNSVCNSIWIELRVILIL